MQRIDSPIFTCGRSCAREQLDQWVSRKEKLIDQGKYVIEGYDLPPIPTYCTGGSREHECAASVIQQGSIIYQEPDSAIDSDIVVG